LATPADFAERFAGVIKPAAFPYDVMKPEDLVVVDLEGKVWKGVASSSDLRRT